VSQQYNWSYIRSEINPNDIELIDDRLITLHNSFIVEFDLSGVEVSRYDIKKELNLNSVSGIEIDSKNNIWLFSDSGDILVLDENYNWMKDFTYLNVDQLDKCVNIEIESSEMFFCTYIDNNNLGILEFDLSSGQKPVYNDYYPIANINSSQSVMSDLDFVNNEIFLTTNEGVYRADITSNLKLPTSWSVCLNSDKVISTLDLDQIFIFTSNSNDLGIDIINKEGDTLNSLDYSPSDLIDVILFNEIYMVLLFRDEIITLTINSYNENSIDLEFYSSHLIDSSNYKMLRSYSDLLIALIYSQGLQVMSEDNSVVHVIPNSPSINGYSAIKLLDEGFVAAGIFENEEISSASTVHFNGTSYVNYIPEVQINQYNTENEFVGIPIDYKVGNSLPLSIIDIGNSHILFSNSGLIQSSDNAGGVIELDLENRELVNIFNSENTEVLGGLDGIYNSSWTTNYIVINQMIKRQNKVWIVNPYNEYYGNIISTYDIQTGNWSSLNASDEYLYLPEEMAFDQNGQIWMGFDYEQTLSSGQVDYSMGGIRYINTNNQFTEVSNDEELIGGERVDVWSIDICDYSGFDILWVLTNDGAQGYTIFENQIAPILNLDLFTEIQFSKGDHIRCDDFSNVWITTRHSGVRVILSAEGYTDYWPSYTGLTSSDSGLLSDVVYDIDFDAETGEVYLATDQGISILNSPFTEIKYSDDEYDIYFNKNPFLVPSDEQVTISNIPIGSSLKVMNLRGKILYSKTDINFTEYQWDGKGSNGKYLNSGVYFITVSHPNHKTVIEKLAIIRDQ